MIYAGIDVNIISHARAYVAGPEAMGLWCWSMCYAQVHQTDGRVHRAASLAAWGGRRNIMLAKRLVEAGLWVPREDGDWDIHNYDRKNQSANEIQRKRDAAKERKDRWRERRENANGTRSKTFPERDGTSLTPSLPPPLQTPTPLPPPDLNGAAAPEPEEVTGVRRRMVGPDGDSGVLFSAYVAGVSEATGRPMSALQVPDRKALVAFVNAHADGADGESLEAWVREIARAFAKQHDPTFGGFSPVQCAKWLDGGRRARAKARDVPRQQLGSAASAPWMNPQPFDFEESK